MGKNSKDAGSQPPHRSKSVPHSTTSSSTEGPKRALTTMPVPSTTNDLDTRQRTRTASNPKTQSSANARGGAVPRLPDTLDKKGSLQGANFVVEDPTPSRSTREAEARGREHEDPPSSYLAPPRRPYNPTSTSDTRQSTSTFLTQTEHSSYYSLEDNTPSVGGPSMPQPQPTALRMPQPYHRDSINNDSETSSDQDLSPEAQYEKLWNAAQTGAHAPPPPMPAPEIASQSMPAPYLYEGEDNAVPDNIAELGGKEGAKERKRLDTRRQDGEAATMPEYRRQRQPSNENRHASIGPGDQYSSSRLGPSPGMPAPSVPTATPSMPTPSSHSQTQHPASTLANSPNSAVPAIAPLRVHHPRPAATGQATSSSAFSTTSNAPAPAATTVNNPLNSGRQHYQTHNTTTDVPKPHDSRPGAGSTIPSNSYSRPSNAPSSNQSSSERPNYVVPNFGPQKLSPVDPRPPGASAPGTPSGISSSVTQAHRPPHGGSAHTQTHNQPQKPPTPTNSAFSSSQAGSRIEHHQTPAPAAPTGQSASTLYGQTGQGKLPTSILLNNNKPSIPNVPQHQPPKPATSVPTGLTSSASVGPTKPHNSTAISQTQSSHSTHGISQASRPQAQTHTEPSKPPVSAPQMHTSTSSNHHSQSKVEHHSKPAAPAPATTPSSATAAISSAPTRPHFHGNPSQMDTQYVNMLLALDDIPALHNIAAQFFTWILLAGFILFPGTFTSLQNGNTTIPETVRQELLKVVTNLPL